MYINNNIYNEYHSQYIKYIVINNIQYMHKKQNNKIITPIQIKKTHLHYPHISDNKQKSIIHKNIPIQYNKNMQKYQQKQKSIIYEYMQQIPPLLDLSRQYSNDGSIQDVSRSNNNKIKRVNNNMIKKIGHQVNSIYIDEGQQQYQSYSNNNKKISTQDTQVPQSYGSIVYQSLGNYTPITNNTISNQENSDYNRYTRNTYNNSNTIDNMIDNSAKIRNRSNTHNSSDNKYKTISQIQQLTFQTYSICNNNSQNISLLTSQLKQKKQKIILSQVLTNSSKLQKYLQYLTQQTIQLKQQPYNNIDSRQIQEIEQINYRNNKYIQVIDMLKCILIKIQTNSVINDRKIVQISTDKTGEININIGNTKNNSIKFLYKYNNNNTNNTNNNTNTNANANANTNNKQNNKHRHRHDSIQQNNTKIKQLQTKLQQQQHVIQQIKLQYDQIINNYAITLNNLYNNYHKKQDKNRNNYISDQQLQKVIGNNSRIDPSVIFNRISIQSKKKSKINAGLFL